ncbi:MAG: hypothetical protein AAB914_02905 [Patescibacteria group bacterium]
MAVRISAKRLAIDKANSTVLIAVGIACFVVVLCSVAGKSLIDQMRYQSKVIGQKEDTLVLSKKNEKAAEQLKTSYQEFASRKENVLGGNSSGTADRDGDNARIVLDALPSKYDFPALTTSLEKLLTGNGFKLDSITGTDDEVAQSATESGANSVAVEIPFTVGITTSTSNTKQLLSLFEKSIRPMQISKLSLKGESNGVKVSVDGKTYFQPQKKFNVKVEKVSASDKADKAKKTEVKK